MYRGLTDKAIVMEMSMVMNVSSLVFGVIALLVATAGMALAGSNPTLCNSRGANQKNCQFNGNKNNPLCFSGLAPSKCTFCDIICA